jgi:hypothetical protein
MRTTIDIPDQLFRRTKAVAALRGSTMKDLIVKALEREVLAGKKPGTGKRVKLPSIHLSGGRKLDLSRFDLDDLLT